MLHNSHQNLKLNLILLSIAYSDFLWLVPTEHMPLSPVVESAAQIIRSWSKSGSSRRLQIVWFTNSRCTWYKLSDPEPSPQPRWLIEVKKRNTFYTEDSWLFLYWSLYTPTSSHLNKTSISLTKVWMENIYQLHSRVSQQVICPHLQAVANTLVKLCLWTQRLVEKT